MSELIRQLGMKNIYFCIAFLMPLFLAAQKLGHHDVLMLRLTKSPEGVWQPSNPQFLTEFNPKGYNNQPAFFAENELWLTVQNPEDTAQTDLFALHLAKKTIQRITNTPQTSEYSPTLMPGGKRFSTVRVEADGQQRLWSFPTDHSDKGKPVLPLIHQVGYHCWLNDTLVALFIVGDKTLPHSLQVVGIRSQLPRKIAANIGRCLLPTGDGRLAFVQKPTVTTWFLKTWNPTNNIQDILVKMPTGSEDFTLLPDGTYLAGNGPTLFYYKPGRDTDWHELTSLSKYGVKKITRLAAGKDGKLAVVVE
jgi:hypothetical protein